MFGPRSPTSRPLEGSWHPALRAAACSRGPLRSRPFGTGCAALSPAGAGREPATVTAKSRRTEVRSWAHHGTGNQAERQGSPDLMVTAPTVLGTSPQIPVLGGECARQNRGHRVPPSLFEPDGREGALRQPYRCTDFRARRRPGSVEGTAEVSASPEGGSTQ